MIIRNKSALSSLRFQMKRCLTIHGYSGGAREHTPTGDRGADRGSVDPRDMGRHRREARRSVACNRPRKPGRPTRSGRAGGSATGG
ncbi:hypothetical protein BCEP4_1160002 [Burkholderia cepacia]|nr:hypothetical protein BCEP4_1160002 [Burkholderia cepacia]